jgi:VanZ family protein
MDVIKSYKWTIASSVSVLVLLLLPSQVFPKTPRGIIEIDKVVHAVLFGSVTAIFCAEYRTWGKKSPPLFLSLALIGVFAILTEMSQLITQTRHFDIKDFIADIIGIAAALLIMRLIAKLGASRHKSTQ